jgi:hypothetical protein
LTRLPAIYVFVFVRIQVIDARNERGHGNFTREDATGRLIFIFTES